jgi:sterol desaturase/sphingolipid hydroxylase (fatty acid hydroxylase superfamily)
MEKLKRGQNNSKRLFEDNFLEALSKTSRKITVVYYSLILICLISLSMKYNHENLKGIISLFFLGLLFWTFFEYMMHRFLFHLKSKNKNLKRLAYMLHGIHHQNPSDEKRLFMPPLPGALFISLLLLFFYAILGNGAFSFMSGHLLGYLIYTQIHHQLHADKSSVLLKKLHLHHQMHHQSFYNKAYGVSSPLWDYIFQTMPKNKTEKNTQENEHSPKLKHTISEELIN